MPTIAAMPLQVNGGSLMLPVEALKTFERGSNILATLAEGGRKMKRVLERGKERETKTNIMSP